MNESPTPNDELRRAGTASRPRGRRRSLGAWLLLVPFVALLYPPLYAREHPRVAGFPFFLWYQLVWIVLGGAVTWVVFLLRGSEGDRE